MGPLKMVLAVKILEILYAAGLMKITYELGIRKKQQTKRKETID